MSIPTAPFRVSVALLIVTPFAVSGRGADGAAIFENNCASCHGLDGKARTPAGRKIGAKDLSVNKLDDAALAAQVRNGVKNAQGVDVMPSFKERLTPEEVSAVVAHVKTFRKK
jgi:mono/diheme cytochrome c family protein